MSVPENGNVCTRKRKRKLRGWIEIDMVLRIVHILTLSACFILHILFYFILILFIFYLFFSVFSSFCFFFFFFVFFFLFFVFVCLFVFSFWVSLSTLCTFRKRS